MTQNLLKISLILSFTQILSAKPFFGHPNSSCCNEYSKISNFMNCCIADPKDSCCLFNNNFEKKIDQPCPKSKNSQCIEIQFTTGAQRSIWFRQAFANREEQEKDFYKALDVIIPEEKLETLNTVIQTMQDMLMSEFEGFPKNKKSTSLIAESNTSPAIDSARTKAQAKLKDPQPEPQAGSIEFENKLIPTTTLESDGSPGQRAETTLFGSTGANGGDGGNASQDDQGTFLGNGGNGGRGGDTIFGKQAGNGGLGGEGLVGGIGGDGGDGYFGANGGDGGNGGEGAIRGGDGGNGGDAFFGGEAGDGGEGGNGGNVFFGGVAGDGGIGGNGGNAYYGGTPGKAGVGGEPGIFYPNGPDQPSSD